MQPDLEKMTVEQLKALAYDQIGLLEQTQNNLKIINQKIQEKSQVKEELKKDKI